MIPKIIHYCWFGGKPLPELAQKCIESWKKYCPDYEIREWNENNFDVGCCDYVCEAYAAQKWAFVSDYARFKILYEHGGLYFDTDVELIRPIDDIVMRGPFMGCECLSPGDLRAAANPGLGLGANPGIGLYKEILADYGSSHFEPDDRGYFETVVIRTTRILERHGRISTDSPCQIAGVNIYPPAYFCPMNFFTGEFRVTEETRSIHHYAATWLSREEKMITWIEKSFDQNCRAMRCLILPLRLVSKMRNLGPGGTVRFILNELGKKTKLGGVWTDKGTYCILAFMAGGAI